LPQHTFECTTIYTYVYHYTRVALDIFGERSIIGRADHCHNTPRNDYGHIILLDVRLYKIRVLLYKCSPNAAVACTLACVLLPLVRVFYLCVAPNTSVTCCTRTQVSRAVSYRARYYVSMYVCVLCIHSSERNTKGEPFRYT